MSAHIFVIGNEKGGAGKSTTCVHLAIGLAYLGFKVTTIDADTRQQTCSRYFENRQRAIKSKSFAIPVTNHVALNDDINALSEFDLEAYFVAQLNQHANSCDFIIIDTPGSNTTLSRIAHSYADTIITPINDSYIDLDVLAKFNPNTYEVEALSIYTQTIWEQKMNKIKRSKGEIEWLVLRNRLGSLDAKNKRNVENSLGRLAKRMGMRIIGGFSERVIFRELFLNGLTVLDLEAIDKDSNLTMSHIAAKQEVRQLIISLNLKQINDVIANGF